MAAERPQIPAASFKAARTRLTTPPTHVIREALSANSAFFCADRIEVCRCSVAQLTIMCIRVGRRSCTCRYVPSCGQAGGGREAVGGYAGMQGTPIRAFVSGGAPATEVAAA